MASAAASDMKKNSKAAAKMLKSIGNQCRLLILCNLEGKEMSVSQLNSQINLSQSALSQHLAILRKDGLVKTRRASQTIYYSMADDRASQILQTLHKMYCAN
jgi:DNA-binding transcriptional ArsR family regulator